MKIAIITSGIIPVPAVQGGAVENLIDYYLQYNDQHQLHELTIYSAWHPDVEKHQAMNSEVNHYEYVKTHSLWFRLCAKLYGMLHQDCYYFYQLEFFFEIVMKKICSKKYDLIIIENRPGIAIKLSKLCNVPIITHLHTNLLNNDTPKKEEIIRATTKFFVVSEYLKKEIENLGGNANIKTIYNGLDPACFNPYVKTKVHRKSLGFKEDDFVAIYTGRIVPQKGVKELILAFQQLSPYRDIKLLIVGGNNFGDSRTDNAFIKELKHMAQEINDKIFFTGYIPYELLPTYLKIVDVAIVPSQINEAFGMTCIEATAMGLPVIATNDGGIPEALNGQKHILINKEEPLPQQIADAVLEIKIHQGNYAGNTLNPKFTKDIYAKTLFQSIES